MSDLADLPPGLKQWDALDVDRTRRYEFSAGTLSLSLRPYPMHQSSAQRITRLLNDQPPDGFEAVPESEVTTDASSPPSVGHPTGGTGVAWRS